MNTNLRIDHNSVQMRGENKSFWEERQIDIERDSLTGLYYNWAFFKKADEKLKEIQSDTYSMVAVDIEHFRLFNKLYGRNKGDELLAYIAGCIKEIEIAHNGVAGYMGGDNFCILMPNRMELLQELQKNITAGAESWGKSAGFMPAFGVYNISDPSVESIMMYDRATIALSHVTGVYVKRICHYDSSMVDQLEEELTILSEVETALKNDEFTFYAQPQCDIFSGKIVGAESLVRWNHGEKGMISPGVFIPVLEKNGYIADLDKHIWEKVCKWLRDWLDRGYIPVPISINVSRIDIFLIDVPTFLADLMKKYDLKPKYLKVEITESAYAENDDRIKKTVKQLQDAGFLVMMDDFGSGYSSLNMLKSVAVDVLKIDMRFLDIKEQENEKGLGILESVVNMSRQMGLPIIVEGVETQKQEDFLAGMGCRYTQGYYYYKPLPIPEFEQLLKNRNKLDFNGFWCKQGEALHVRELFDSNLFSDTMLNNILGPAAFYDVYEDEIEITRVNEQYYQLAGMGEKAEETYSQKLWNHVQDDDQPFLLSLFDQAYSNPLKGAQGYVRYMRADGKVLWVYMRVFFLREREEHKIFYSSLTDVTKVYEEKTRSRLAEQIVSDWSEEQKKRMEEFYDDMPCGFGIAKILMNEDRDPTDYDIVYINHEMERLSGGDLKRFRMLVLKLFAGNAQAFMEKCYRAAFCGEVVTHYSYSTASNRYLQITFYQYEYGYVGCILEDVTYTHIYADALNNMLKEYREVYYLQLEDNYYRMIYPNENYVQERGNYEEAINRHFGSGRIASYDEKNVRRFLSLENLKEVLEKEDSTEYKYLRSLQGGPEEWCLTNITICERNGNGEPKTAIMTIRSVDALLKLEEEQQKQKIAEMLATMSEGFFIYRAEADEKILYASPSVIRMFGCDDMKDFRNLVGNSFRGMVHPDDVERVEQEIADQIRSSDQQMDYTEYRIIRKDGTIRYLKDWGHLEDTEENNKLFYVIIKDVTDNGKFDELT